MDRIVTYTIGDTSKELLERHIQSQKLNAKSKTKVERHKEIVDGLNQLYAAKNTDYGDSVHDTYEKYGLVSFLVRLEDKLNRARTLAHNQKAQVTDEKLEDTLLDMANYAILAVIELQGDKHE